MPVIINSNTVRTSRGRSRPKKKTRPNPKKQKQKQPVPKRTRSSPLTAAQSCARRYIAAMTDPFGPQARGACIPRFPAPNSYKFTSTAKSTFQVNALGDGFVGAQAGWTNDNSITGIFTAKYSFTGTYANTGIPASGAVTGCTTTGDTSSQSAGSYGTGNSQNRGRLVGMGLRARYIGNDNSCAGRYVVCNTISGEPLDNMTIANLLARRSTYTVPITTDRKWVTVAWAPADSDDLDYLGGSQPASTSSIGIHLAIVVSGGAPSSSFEFEVIRHCEVRGFSFEQSLSPNAIVDAPILDAVSSSVSDKISEDAPAGPGLFTRAIESAAKTVNSPEGRNFLLRVLDSGMSMFQNSHSSGAYGESSGYLTDF